MVKTNKIHVGNFDYKFNIDDVIKLTGIITTNLVCVEEDKIPSIIKEVYTPQKNDKLYLYPECTIPRFKLKSFCEKYKVSIIRDINKANVLFTKSCYVIDQYFNKSGNHPGRLEGLNREYFINYLKIVAISTYKGKDNLACWVDEDDFSFKSVDFYFLEQDYNELIDYINKQHNKEDLIIYDLVKFIADISKVTDKFIYVDNHHSWKMYNYGLNSISFKYEDELKSEIIDNECFMYFIDDEKEKSFETLINHTGVYTEHSLLEQINSELQMDKDLYEGIANLFDSDNDDSIVIAMEAMANSNYKDSAPYLLLLYESYQGEISNSRSRNHINFKSFLNYFDLNTRGSIDVYDIIDRLIAKNILNTKNFKIIEPLLFESLRNQGERERGRNSNNSTGPYFTIDIIKPNDYIKNIIEKTDLIDYNMNNSTEIILAETTNIEIL